MHHQLWIAPLIQLSNWVFLNELILVSFVLELSDIYHVCVHSRDDSDKVVQQEDVRNEDVKHHEGRERGFEFGVLVFIRELGKESLEEGAAGYGDRAVELLVEVGEESSEDSGHDWEVAEHNQDETHCVQ